MAAQPNAASVSTTTNKRKRSAMDQGGDRDVKAPNTNGDHDTSSFGLMLQGDGIFADDNTRTAQAALAAPGMNPSGYPEPNNQSHGDNDMSLTFAEGSPPVGSLAGAQANANNNGGAKPQVGSQEWHQQRKDNHKEVERRRREVINEGIENIAKIIPGTEKNKGAILQRTYEYIQELLNEKNKWQDERATFDIALKELTSRLERMKESARTAWAETSKWQSRCREAGLPFDDYDDGGLTGLDDDDGVTGLSS